MGNITLTVDKVNTYVLERSKIMNRWLKILGSSILASALLFGCANNEEDPAPPEDNNVDENQDLNDDVNDKDGLMEDHDTDDGDRDRGVNDDDGILEDNLDDDVLDDDKNNGEDIIEDPDDVRDEDRKDNK